MIPAAMGMSLEDTKQDKPGTKVPVFESIYMNGPEEATLKRQGCQGLGEGERGK